VPEDKVCGTCSETAGTVPAKDQDVVHGQDKSMSNRENVAVECIGIGRADKSTTIQPYYYHMSCRKNRPVLLIKDRQRVSAGSFTEAGLPRQY